MEYKVRKASSGPIPPKRKKLTTFADALKCSDPVLEVHDAAHDLICADGSDKYSLSRLSDSARLIYLVQLFDLEMLNGGLIQFFCNSSGNFAIETCEALRRISAKHSLSILQRAIDVFPDGLFNSERRNERCHFVWDQQDRQIMFDRLNGEYDDSVHSFADEPTAPENLWHLCLTFIKEYPNSLLSAGG